MTGGGDNDSIHDDVPPFDCFLLQITKYFWGLAEQRVASSRVRTVDMNATDWKPDRNAQARLARNPQLTLTATRLWKVSRLAGWENNNNNIAQIQRNSPANKHQQQRYNKPLRGVESCQRQLLYYSNMALAQIRVALLNWCLALRGAFRLTLIQQNIAEEKSESSRRKPMRNILGRLWSVIKLACDIIITTHRNTKEPVIGFTFLLHILPKRYNRKICALVLVENSLLSSHFRCHSLIVPTKYSWKVSASGSQTGLQPLVGMFLSHGNDRYPSIINHHHHQHHQLQRQQLDWKWNK